MIDSHNCIELPDINSGDNGKYVELLQLLLNGKGYYCGNVDGICGMRTLMAVNKVNVDASQPGTKGCNIETWLHLLNK